MFTIDFTFTDMRRGFNLALASLVLAACNKTGDTASAAASTASTPPAAAVSTTGTPVHPELLGLYTGQFTPNPDFIKVQQAYAKATADEMLDSRNLEDTPAKFRPYMVRNPLYGIFTFRQPTHLSVILDAIDANHTFRAHSVAAGNARPVTGTWEDTAKGLHLMGAEPGDHPVDGKFDLTLSPTHMEGSWTSAKPGSQAKPFSLKKTTFKYTPDNTYVDLGEIEFDGNPSTARLKTADVENLTQPQIRMIRNLIFARHGYAFTSEEVRAVFEAQDWYIPLTTNVNADLTEVEKQNLALLKRYEQYASKNYASFGR